MTTPLPSLGLVVPSCPEEVVAWVDRAVAYDIEERWPDAAAMQSALRELRGSEQIRIAVISEGPDVGLAGPDSERGSASSASVPVDSAPVLFMDGDTRHERPSNVTAAGTVGPARHASRPPRPRVAGTAAVTFLAVIAVLVGARAMMGSKSSPASKPRTVAVANPPPPESSAAAGSAPALPPADSPAPPPTSSASVAVTPASTPSGAPLPSASGSVVARPDRVRVPWSPRPAGPAPGTSSKPRTAPTAPDNPLDQRF